MQTVQLLGKGLAEKKKQFSCSNHSGSPENRQMLHVSNNAKARLQLMNRSMKELLNSYEKHISKFQHTNNFCVCRLSRIGASVKYYFVMALGHSYLSTSLSSFIELSAFVKYVVGQDSHSPKVF